MAPRGTGFLTVVPPEEARRLWDALLPSGPGGTETVDLDGALGRVPARAVLSPEDVPSFRRSDRDGFAVRARDTFGATEEAPLVLRRATEVLTPGRTPVDEHAAGAATEVATGAVVPRGADAVLMVEYTGDGEDGSVHVTRPVVPGENVTQAGTDLSRGEVVARPGAPLSFRDTAVLAACGVARVEVWRRPRVAVISTGDEIAGAAAPLREGLVRDANGRALADGVRAAGGDAVERGVVPDDGERLREALLAAARECDLVLVSGGTSKGAGDLAASVLSSLEDTRVVVHGVALRPGKPLLLGAIGDVPLAVLPGFPTSAVFTFHAFVAPAVRRLAGLPPHPPGETVAARLAVRLRSKRGFMDFTLVDLVRDRDGLVAWPVGKGSGSVTTFARADGFVAVDPGRDQVEAGETVQVVPLGEGGGAADLTVVGSHCAGVDLLAERLRAETGYRVKVIAAGSTAGLDAARRGACDCAGVHLLDEATDRYNAPFVEGDPTVRLLPGYGRRQGWVFRPGDGRFEGRDAAACAAAAAADPAFLLAQRNRGSGTRLLLDRLFGGDASKLRGGDAELRSHTAVCAAVRHGKADGGLAEESVARGAGLGFAFLREERFDFLVPADRWERPAVAAFRGMLASSATMAALREAGFTTGDRD